MFSNPLTEIECKRCFSFVKRIPHNDKMTEFEENWLCCPECFTRMFIKSE